MKLFLEKLAVERANYQLAQITALLHQSSSDGLCSPSSHVCEALLLLERVQQDLLQLQDFIDLCTEKAACEDVS